MQDFLSSINNYEYDILSCLIKNYTSSNNITINPTCSKIIFIFWISFAHRQIKLINNLGGGVSQFIIIIYSRYMASLKQENCQNCCNSFTPHNPPRRLINCHHYMCQRCLISQKFCKKCGADIGLNDHFLKDYVVVTLAEIEKEIKNSLQQIKHQDQIEDHELLEEYQEHHEIDNFHKDQFFVQQCLLHSKPADLICLTDKAIICSSCALFGKHKGHQVSNREGILTKFTVFVEDCLRIYDEIKQQNTKFSPETYRSQYMKMVSQKKQLDQKKISEKFEALISTIKVLEKKQQLKLNEFYKEKQKFFEVKQPKIQKLQSQIKKWMLQIQNIGTLMSDTSSLQKIADFLPYIDQKSNTGAQVLQKGEKLMQRYLEVQEELTKDLKKQKQTDYVKFDEEKIKQIYQYVIIKGESTTAKRPQSASKPQQSLSKSPICLKQSAMKFKSSSKKQHLRTQTDAFAENLNIKIRPEVNVNGFLQDNLLLSVDHSAIQMQKIKGNTNVYLERVQVAQELDVENIPHLSISDIRPVTNMSSGQSSDQSRFLIRDRQLKQFVNDGFVGLTVQISKQDPKKKKKVDFPEKYKGTVDDLKNDRAETIDLTGAEVGDGTILSLCPFIKKSKKLKTLKLIKNKLTDDCLSELFEALAQSRACSLNLSQNLLTDKSCLIISSSPISPSLKTITLTLNKLNRRNVKVKIDELAKKNITVLL